MLYIIGGTSRSGKTLIASKILNTKNIPFLSLDFLVMGFTNGVPEYGIHDKLFPDEIAKRMWKFVNSMCENIIWVDNDYVVEGEAILPEHVIELQKKHPGKVRTCFLGYTEIDISEKIKDIKTFSLGKSDWLSKEPDNYISKHISNMLTYSLMIKKECIKHKLEYFDTSSDFLDTINSAVKYLTEA